MAKGQNNQEFATAPYNFISFPKGIVYRYKGKEELPKHNKYYKDCNTGYIEFDIRAINEIFVGDGRKEDTDFFKNEKGEYVIPASTLRGLIRSNVEKLSFSYPEFVEDRKFLFRTMAGGTRQERDSYNQRLKQGALNKEDITDYVRAGYMVREKDGYYIIPSEEIGDSRKNFLTVDEFVIKDKIKFKKINSEKYIYVEKEYATKELTEIKKCNTELAKILEKEERIKLAEIYSEEIGKFECEIKEKKVAIKEKQIEEFEVKSLEAIEKINVETKTNNKRLKENIFALLEIKEYSMKNKELRLVKKELKKISIKNNKVRRFIKSYLNELLKFENLIKNEAINFFESELKYKLKGLLKDNNEAYRLYSLKIKNKMEERRKWYNININNRYRPYEEKIYFKVSSNYGVKLLSEKQSSEDEEELLEGKLYNCYKINGKRKHYIVNEKNKQEIKIKVPDSLINSYIADLKNKMFDTRGDKDLNDELRGFYNVPNNNDEDEKEKVFFYKLDRQGNIKYFGRTPYLRIFYDYSIKEYINMGAYKNCRDNKIDYAKALFGLTKGSRYANGENQKLEYSYKGRLAFIDAKLDDESKSVKLDDVDLILSSPKPTSYQLYMKQPANDKYINYNSEPKESELRGYKFYWQRNVKRPDGKKDNGNSNIKPKLRPLSKGSVFKAKLNFENLSDEELGLLLLAIRYDEVSNYNESIGMGKPYGYGLVNIENIEVYINDIEDRYSDFWSVKYKNLDLNERDKKRSKFKEEMKLYTEKEYEKMKSIHEYKVSKQKAKSNEKIEYMELNPKDRNNGFRKRNKLEEALYVFGDVKNFEFEKEERVINQKHIEEEVTKPLEHSDVKKEVKSEVVEVIEYESELEEIADQIKKAYTIDEKEGILINKIYNRLDEYKEDKLKATLFIREYWKKSDENNEGNTKYKNKWSGNLTKKQEKKVNQIKAIIEENDENIVETIISEVTKLLDIF